MPTLTDPRAEAFAQYRARGANLENAYELAGFAGGQGHDSRFARRGQVAARIGELIEAGRREMRDPAALAPERPDWAPHLHSAALRFVRDDGERM